MKKIFSFIVFMIISLNVFGLSGALAGYNDLKVVNTKYFQIIYPEECEKTASLLYEKADDIFTEVTAQYGLKPSFSLPVVITPGLDIVNAFFTSYPYNRIVLYDSSSQIADELSTVFSENFLSIFRHELTHAVTFNIKNGFWSGLTSFFGDGFLPGDFFVTSGMAEGAAVASESFNGEGRLNNEYTRHFVKQAKIENKFPSYFDVQGVADSLIPGVQYYFNGEFHRYLQNKYGMEKYTSFWYKVTNLTRIGVLSAFKKVYGVSLRKEWKTFASEFEVPQNIRNIDSVNSYFKNQMKNDGGFRYASLASFGNNIVYIDRTSNNVYLNEKLLFTKNGTDNITVSKDGRFITVSYITDQYSNIKSKIKIYDVKNDMFFSLDETGLKNGCVVSDENDYYLVSHNYKSTYNNINIKKIEFENDKIKEVRDVNSIKQELNIFCSNFIDLGKGNFAYIKKDRMNFSIGIGKIEKENDDYKVYTTKEYNMADGIILHDISFSDNKEKDYESKIYFSYVKKGTMPRIGYVSLNENSIFLSNVDINGGIYNPVVQENKIVYIGQFFNENKILTFDLTDSILTDGEKIYLKDDKDTVINTEKVKDEIKIKDISNIAKDYKRMENLNKGLLIPLSIYSSSFFGNNLGIADVFLPFGITYADSDPWSYGKDDLLLFTAGWGFLTNSIGLGVTLNQGTGTDLFSYQVDIKTEFDRFGWKQSSALLNLSSGFSLGNHSYFAIENNFKIIGGKDVEITDNIFEKFISIEDAYGLNISNGSSIGYSSIHKTGPGRFSKSGFMAKAGYGFIYDSFLASAHSVTANLLFNFPNLIPLICKDGFTYNLPLKFSLSLFPMYSSFGLSGYSTKEAGNAVMDFNIETVLFGMDVQHSVPYFEILYLQDFYLTFGYTSTIASYKGSKRGFQIPYIKEYFENLGNGKSKYLDAIYLNLVADLSANIGVLANSMFKASVYAQIKYPINVLNEKDSKIQFVFGLGGRF